MAKKKNAEMVTVPVDKDALIEELKKRLAELEGSNNGINTVDMSLEEIKDKAIELVGEYNELVTSGTLKQISDKESVIMELVSKYDEKSEAQTFASLREYENVMAEAAKKLTYNTIKVSLDKVKGSNVIKRKIDDSTKYINIKKLHDTTTGGIGAKSDWMDYIDAICMHLAAFHELKFGRDPQNVVNNFKMREEAYKLECIMSMTEPCKFDGNPDDILKANMQEAVSAMLGEGYKVIDADVHFFRESHTTHGNKTLTVKMLSSQKIRRIMLELCHRILLSESYTLDYQKKN